MPARGTHAAVRVCQICALCSGAHGAELYRRLFGALNTGAMSPYVAFGPLNASTRFHLDAIGRLLTSIGC